MDRRFPAFKSNYPSSLLSLADYVAQKQREMATRPRTSASRPSYPPSSGYGAGAGAGGGERPVSQMSFRSGASSTRRFFGGDSTAEGAGGRSMRRGGSGLSGSMGGTARSMGGHGARAAHLMQGPASHPSFRLGDVSSRRDTGRATREAPVSPRYEAPEDAADAVALDLADEVGFEALKLKSLLAAYVSLRRLSLARSYVTDDIIELVADHCPLLDELDVTATFPLTAGALASTLLALPRLRVLHVSKCDHMFSDPAAVAELMAAIADPASLIQDLRLNNNPSLDDDALLALYRPPAPADPVIGEFNATGDPLKAPEPVASPRLRQASTSGGRFGSSSARNSTAAPAPAPAPAPVDRADPDGHDRHEKMDEWFYAAGGAGAGAGHGSRRRKKPASAPLPLVCLDLSGCRSITDRGLVPVLSACTSLQQLRMQLCDQETITDAPFEVIGEHLHELVSLDLTGCAQLSPKAIQTAVSGCRRLQTLVLSGCGRVNDQAVAAIGRSCRDLVHIDLTLCTEVSFSSVHQLTATCPKLRFVNLTMCTKIEDEHIAFLTQASPAVQILRHATAYTDPSVSSIVPGFKVPPRKQQWRSVTNMSNFKRPKAKGKGKKGKKGKKKK